MINKTYGFSLIELIITLAIVMVLVIQGHNWLYPLLRKYSAINESHQLFHTLQFARSEAIKRNQVVQICGSENDIECSSDWSKGYMVFIENENHSPQKTLLRTQKNSTLSKIHSGKLKTIAYASDGRCLTRGTN
jgi:prepilin-type N-terminal cleavage/methylation domain-containing protein